MIEFFINFANENPRTYLVVISLLVSFISTLITKYTTDQALLKSIKERQSEIQKELKEKKYLPEDKRFLELQKEMLELTGKMMKNSFKPMLITLIPFFILFSFLRKFFTPILGSSWIWYYLIPSLLVGSFYRKVLKIS